MAQQARRVDRLTQHLIVQKNTATEGDTRMPVALVLGAGAGIGQNVARKFALEGYHAVSTRGNVFRRSLQ